MATCKPCFLESDRRAKQARARAKAKKAEPKPAELFYVNVRTGAVDPTCSPCRRAQQRNRTKRNQITYVLGKLLLWRMAYDAAFAKNFLQTP